MVWLSSIIGEVTLLRAAKKLVQGDLQNTSQSSTNAVPEMNPNP